MHDNLAELTKKLRAIRQGLEANADRAAALQVRLRTDAPTIVALDKLASRPSSPPVPRQIERFEGDEIAMNTDAWEISLINDEG